MGSILLILIVYALIVHFGFNDPKDSGTFGDMFGGVNALFSGFAFAGLLAAIMLQKEELGLQREELEQTREELKGQKEQLEEQNKTMRLQRFESTFFNLIEILQDSISRIQLNGEIGRITFRGYYNILASNIISNFNATPVLETERKQAFLKQLIKSFINNDGNGYLVHYFGLIKGILNLIDTSDIGDKYYYINLLKLQLSKYELSLILYFGLLDEEIKISLERYSLLTNITNESLVSVGEKLTVAEQKTFYATSAFNT